MKDSDEDYASHLVGLGALLLGMTLGGLLLVFAGKNGGIDIREWAIVGSALIIGPSALWLTARRTRAIEEQVKEAAADRKQRADELGQTLAEAAADRAERSDQARVQRLADRFSRSVEQLGSAEDHIRAAAAHALGQIALEDWRSAEHRIELASYYPTIIDILSGFARERCSVESKTYVPNADDAHQFPDGYRLPVDIEAALVALSGCNRVTSAAHNIDLRGADLRCWCGLMQPLDLTSCQFGDADISGVLFRRLVLSKVDFGSCKADQIRIDECTLTECDLVRTDDINITITSSLVCDSQFLDFSEEQRCSRKLTSCRLVDCELNEYGHGNWVAENSVLDRCDIWFESSVRHCMFEGENSNRLWRFGNDGGEVENTLSCLEQYTEWSAEAWVFGGRVPSRDFDPFETSVTTNWTLVRN